MSELSSNPLIAPGQLMLNEVQAAEAGKTVTVDGRHYTVLGDEEKIRQLYERLPSQEVSAKQFDAVLKQLGVPDFTTAKADRIGSQILIQEVPPSESPQAKERREAVESGLVPLVPTLGGPDRVIALEQRMKELQIKGVSIAVIKDGKRDWVHGYGELKWEKGAQPPLSQAGSIGKMFTSLLWLSLIEKNPTRFPKGLDTDIRPILENSDLGKDIWNLIDPKGLTEGKPITIRHLLSHTSGIGEGGSEYYNRELLMREISLVENTIQNLMMQKGAPGATLDNIESINKQVSVQEDRLLKLQGLLKDEEKDPLPSLNQILRGETKLGPVQVKTTPGEKFEYSNPGYDILQKLALCVTGEKDFTKLLREKVFEKIGMDETQHHAPLERTTHGNERGEPLPCSWWEIPHLGAGGSLWTHAEDLAKAIPFLQKTLAGKESSLVTRDTLLEAMQETSAEKEYRLGFEVEQIEGGPLYFGHSGGTPGFTAKLIANTAGDGVVILTNENLPGAKPIIQEIIRSVANAYNWPGKEKLSHCQRAEISPPSNIEEWVNGPNGVGGTYEVEATEKQPKHTAYVHLSEGKVLAEVDGGEAEGGPTVLLTPLTANTASYRERKTVPVESVCEFKVKEGKKGLTLFDAFFSKI